MSSADQGLGTLLDSPLGIPTLDPFPCANGGCGDDTVSYAITSTLAIDNLSLRLGVDNGVFVWLNGNYLFGSRAGGGSALGEYGPLALGSLGGGTNYLQILREDHGATGFDIELTGGSRCLSSPRELRS